MLSLNCQVIIVGAGPTGLTLAAELAGAGIHCRVVERRAEPSPHSRAFTVMSYTLELFDMRGLADTLVRSGLPTRYGAIGDGKRYLDFGRLDSRFPFMLLLPQHDTEEILESWAVRCGAEILRNACVTAVTQDDQGVSVQIEHAGRRWTERALYLVGCDGVHSPVRKFADIPFEGRAYDASLIIADVQLRNPPDPVVHARISRRGMGAVFPFPRDLFRLILLDHERMHVPLGEPVTLAEIQASARALFGVDLGIHDPIWLSRFRSEQRQAARYRQGRIFLAGDAAHTHIPSGGQGLQMGVQDAFNLGWKLAAHLRGRAPQGLLDSYQQERYPIAAETLRQTDLSFRYETSRSAWVIVARQAAMQLMRLKGVQRSVINNFAGFRLRYPQPGTPSNPFMGRRIPDVTVTGPDDGASRIHELLQRRVFILVDQSRDGMFAAAMDRSWPDRPRVVRGRVSNRTGLPTAFLVRPDGIVAWASTRGDLAGLRNACRRWCGEPEEASVSTAQSPDFVAGARLIQPAPDRGGAGSFRSDP